MHIDIDKPSNHVEYTVANTSEHTEVSTSEFRVRA